MPDRFTTMTKRGHVFCRLGMAYVSLNPEIMSLENLESRPTVIRHPPSHEEDRVGSILSYLDDLHTRSWSDLNRPDL